MPDDAGFLEVFRGDLSEIELAAGVLEENGIEFERRWEQAGAASFAIRDTALLPGRAAILLVPSVAYDEARELLDRFAEPEPEYLDDFSAEVAHVRNKRRTFARVVAVIVLAPVAIWLVVVLYGLLSMMFR